MPRLLLATLALLGLLAMHGLGTHGVHGDDATGQVGAHPHAASEPVGLGSVAEAVPVGGCSDGCGQHTELLTVMLCVAVLLAGLALLRPRSGLLGALVVPGRLLQLPSAPAARRRRRPPDLLALSILRC